MGLGFMGFMVTHIWGTTQSVGLLWTRDQLVAETSTWQNTQHSQETDIDAPGGIRTHDPSKREAEDPCHTLHSLIKINRIINLIQENEVESPQQFVKAHR
jgi:hypothetical protein